MPPSTARANRASSPVFLVPFAGQLGETRLLCKGLRLHGAFVGVIAASDDADCFADCADAVAVCSEMQSEDAIVSAVEPFRGRPLQLVSAPDRIWPALLGAARRLEARVPGFQGQVNCRIKPRMRALLDDIVPLRSDVVRAHEATPARIEAVLEHVGLPCVVKPIWGCGSESVSILESAAAALPAIAATFATLREQQPAAFEIDGIRYERTAELLVEEYAAGREFSFEGFVQRGVVVPLMIQEKYKRTRHGTTPIEIANLGPTPRLGPEETAVIHRTTREALARLGVDDTFFHAELTWDGRRMNVIEINPRLGGGSVPRMLDYWFGIDVREMNAKLQAGAPLPAAYEGRDGFLLGVFARPHAPGVLASIDGLDWVRRQPEYCFETSYFRRGHVIPPETTYFYDVFFRCRDLERADALCAETLQRVRPSVAPAHASAL